MQEHLGRTLSEDHITPLHSKIMRGHDGNVFELGFAHDGRRMACAGSPQGITVWATGTGTRLSTLLTECKRDPVFSPSDNYFTACSHDGVEVWAMPSAQHINRVTYSEKESGGMIKALVDRIEKKIVVLAYSNVRTCNLRDGSQVDLYRFFPAEVIVDARIDENNRALVFSCRVEKKRFTHLFVTSLAEKKRLLEVPLDGDRPPIVASNGQFLLNPPRGKRKCYQVWSLQDGTCLSEISFDGIITGRPANPFAREGQLLVHASGDIRVWDTQTGEVVSHFNLPEGWLAKVWGCANDKVLVAVWSCGSQDTYRVRFVDPLTGTVLGEAQGHTNSVPTFSPCGRWFATVSDNNYCVEREKPLEAGTIVLTDLSAIR